MVANESWRAEQFFLDGGRRGLQVDQVSDKAVRQDCEEQVFDEVGQLFADEVGVIVGGLVAALGSKVQGGVDVCTGTPLSHHLRRRAVAGWSTWSRSLARQGLPQKEVTKSSQ